MRGVIAKLLSSVCLCIICLTGNAQTVIQMEEYGGVYRIPCKVNGAKMKLIFDTGAGNVCLSLTMAEYLFDNDFISADDIIGTGTSSVADGRIVDHVIINIKDIEIEGNHLNNVKAVVIDGQNAPLLLGQSAIQKLGSIEINGNILVIKNGNNPNDDEYINRLFEEAEQAYDNNLFSRAEEKYGQLYALDQLSNYGVYMYTWACYMNDNLAKAEELLNTINDYTWFDDNKVDIYRLTGHILKGREKYYEALNYYKLSTSKFYSNTIETNNVLEKFKNSVNIADCYSNYGDDMTALDFYIEAINLFAQINGVSVEYIIKDCQNRLGKNEVSYRNDDIDYVLYCFVFCGNSTGKMSSGDYLSYITALARAKNRYAMKTCNKAGINPYLGL